MRLIRETDLEHNVMKLQEIHNRITQEIMSTITSPLVWTNNRPEGKEDFIWKDFEFHAKCIAMINKYKMVISNH